MPEVTDDNIKKLFFEFVEEMDMSASYKPVLMLSFLEAADPQGKARVGDVVQCFRRFYEKRAQDGLRVEQPKARMFRVAELTDEDVRNVIVTMPLRRFQQYRYIDYDRDVEWVKFNTSLWRQLSESDVERIRADLSREHRTVLFASGLETQRSIAMGQSATSSAPEDQFVCLFSEVFGLEKSQLLVPELGFLDVTGGERRIDYAIKTTEGDVAFEIDGPFHYDPKLITAAQYEDDLLRQNSLITYGWRVFRWTDRQLREEPEQVKEQLARFLESVPGLLEFDAFLPQQRGAVLELREHQQEARDWLAKLRAEGGTIAQLNHATGTGKTIIAIDDAKSLGAQTLYLANTRGLVKQTRDRFLQFWPECRPGLWLGRIHDDPSNHGVICASAQSIVKALSDFAPDAFDYVIVDEAHHVAGRNLSQDPPSLPSKVSTRYDGHSRSS